MITTKSVAAGLAGVLGATGIALAAPGLAEATTVSSVRASAEDTATQSEDRRQSVVNRITAALSGLVSDGTITNEQADAVATTLAEQAAERGGSGGGQHGRGMGRHEVMAAAAEALGVSQDELRDKLGSATLGEVADDVGVSRDRVVDAMESAASEQIEQAVADGRITQEHADDMLADLETRLTDRLDQSRGERGGPGMRHGERAGADAEQSTPSAAATT